MHTVIITTITNSYVLAVLCIESASHAFYLSSYVATMYAARSLLLKTTLQVHLT